MYQKLYFILQFIAVFSQLVALEPSPIQNLVTRAHDAISGLSKFLQSEFKTSEDFFNESSEKAKEEIRESLDGSKQLPLINIFIAGRKEIEKAATVSGKVVEKCIDETELILLPMGNQLTDSQFACIFGKFRKTLGQILEIENAISALQSKCSHLQEELLRCIEIEDAENKNKCVQDDVITIANQEKTEGKEIIKQINDLVKEFEGVPAKIQICKEHINKFATAKIKKVVNSVPACVEKYKNTEN